MELEQVISLITTAVVLPLLTYLGARLNKYIKTKVEQETVQHYIDIAKSLVEDSVREVAQVYIDKLADGQWNSETKASAFNQAKALVLENMGVAGIDILNRALGDYNQWIETKIEAEVNTYNMSKSLLLDTDSLYTETHVGFRPQEGVIHVDIENNEEINGTESML